jgi:tRNA (cmo5U34)-methyltransferase
MSEQDTLYLDPLEQIADFHFDEKVAAVFPDMIRRSVPGYSSIIGMTGVLAGKFAQPGSRCYDLGCSLGASALSMANRLPAETAIIAVDNSPAMLERCRENFASGHSNIELVCDNIEDVEIANASVVAMNFSLQFVALEKRPPVLEKIHNGLLQGGILILSEKIRLSDPELDALNIKLHHEFKKANGYSELEISQKRSALEKVLIPEPLEEHIARIRSAGFRQCDAWFQCLNFASLIAIK